MTDPELKQDLLQLQIDQTNYLIKVKEFLEKHPDVNQGIKEYFCRDDSYVLEILFCMMRKDNEEQLIRHIGYLVRRVI